ncbi:MAG: hypothetical protein PHW40_04165 [Candidatus Izemoplasmatales bacterium]|nr:hypothetical protein [Candidatus Izemoplasmatales bacterium]
MVLLLFMLFTVINNVQVVGNVSHEIGTEVYFDNTRWEGLKYYRDKNEITTVGDDTTLDLVNQKFITSGTNNTNAYQTIGYSYSAQVGSSFSTKVGANIEVFKVEVGYTFSATITETYTATLSIPPWSTITLYTYDKRTRSTEVEEDETRQMWKWFSWRDDEHIGSNTETIMTYDGVTFVFTQTI